MTWSASIDLPAGEKLDPKKANIAAEEKYAEDVALALKTAVALDTYPNIENPPGARTIGLSGYRSEMTTSISVAVTQRPGQA